MQLNNNKYIQLLNQRLAPDAQPEFREYAQALAEIVKRRVPMCYNAFEIKQQVETEGKLKYKEIITERTK